MLLFLAASALAVLAYYYFSNSAGTSKAGEDAGNKSRRSTPPRGTAKRDRRRDRERRKKKTPQVHRRKIESLMGKEFEHAKSRATKLIEEESAKELAWESHYLAETIRKMFSHDEFFEGGRRCDSFQAALEVARNARDELIARQRKKRPEKEMTSVSGPDSVKDGYVKNAVESALVIGWCAGGLIGKSRYESARGIFPAEISVKDVSSWNRFSEVLREEVGELVARKRDPLTDV